MKYWFDSDGYPHEISKMETGYIYNCLNQLKKALNLWHGIIPEQLTREELVDKGKVMSKAWFVLHGIEYIDAFCEELKKRQSAQ